jgi:hypothetical protein
VFAAIREIQIPLLAVLLLGACSAKLARVLRARSVDVGLGPTALFPLRLQRTVAMAMCAVETALGIALIVTAGRLGAGLPATAVRGATVVLFVTAVGALIEMHQRKPDVGCGCFGDLSTAPVSRRTIARAALLVAAAAASIGVSPVRLPPPGGALTLRLGLLAAEFVLIAALSPEIGEALVRLGYSEPCELRILPSERTLSGLQASRTWRRHASVMTSDQPLDVWRELCWRYLVYPGSYGGRDVEVVFAVYLRSRRPSVRAAIVDAVTGAVMPPLHVLPAPAVAQASSPLPPHAVGMWPTVTRPAAGIVAGERPVASPRPAAGVRPAAAVMPRPGRDDPAASPPSAPDFPQFLAAPTAFGEPGLPEFLAAPMAFGEPGLPEDELEMPDSLYRLLALSTPATRKLQKDQEPHPAGCERRNLPKCGTVNPIRPRSEL